MSGKAGRHCSQGSKLLPSSLHFAGKNSKIFLVLYHPSTERNDSFFPPSFASGWRGCIPELPSILQGCTHMKTTSFKFFVLFSLLSFTCKKNGPITPPDTTVALTADNANCTEVYLELKLGAGITTRSVILKRDSITIFTKTINATDTVLADTGLIPNHTFTYTAILGGETQKCTATTLGTTSSNFTWQSFTLGGAASSALYDVAIINDTLAYAVGQMYINDSTGLVDQQPYNLAIWNGQKWQLIRIYFNTVCGQSNLTPYPATAIFALSDTDIWIAGAGQVVRFNGHSQNPPTCVESPTSFAINRLWGNNANSMYVVGDGGSIAHYNGNNWTKIESGTTLDVRDIWGAQNTNTSAWEIYATAGNPLISPDREIIQISGTTVQAILAQGIGGGLNGIWFSPEHYYWAVGDGTWEKHPTLTDAIWHSQTLTSYTIDAVRGNGINDVFMCGAYGEVLHFNGVSWKSYQTQTGIAGVYLGLAGPGNTVIAVGEEPPQAVVLIGKR